MWSQIALCLLVGLAVASENPAWNQQYHYTYQVRGRSLASLNQISNDYSGIVFKAKLDVQPRSAGNLGAKVSEAKYAKVHAELQEGWETEIPDSQLNYQDLSLSDQPFQIVLNNGAIRDVIVSKKIKNWEANMIKSIVSQLQLDTKATNLIPSSINILTQDDSNTAVFKTMEETVTGVSETLYEVHPYPEYVLQSQPWLVPDKHLIEQGDVIEIVKTKNFTHSPQLPSYHAGLEGVGDFQPGNSVAEFLSRTSVSQAIITGTLQKFTIQSSVTFEEINLSPTLGDNQRGAVSSKLNVTLLHVAQPLNNEQFNVESPVEVGLVYAYDKPYSTDNSPRSAKEYDHGVAPSSAESESFNEKRLSKRSPLFGLRMDEDEEWFQDKPQLSEAPPSPLLPFTVGYDGQSIKKQQNIIETVRKLAEEIGQDFQNANQVIHQQTPGKFVILVSLVRIMDQNEVQQVANQLYSAEDSPSWVTIRDAVAQAGTGPAIQIIKSWISSGKVSNIQAAQIVATAADSSRQPTEEYMKFFHEMIQDNALMSKPHLNESVLLSFTSLVRQVYANRDDSNGKYPVNSYGSFRTQRGQEFVNKNVIPFLTRQLNEAISKADTQKIHVYIRALGNIGQQEILEAFEPYLEGQRKASHYQRTLMVLSLSQLVRSNPRVARSVLYKIYQNPHEVEQVRVAAVYQLMLTNPSPTMLQRMASYTNVDTSNHVNAAVKSLIESASELELPEHEQLRVAAESAKPLLTNEDYGLQYSQGFLESYVVEESQLAYKQIVQTLVGEDNAVPQGIRYRLEKQLGGVDQYPLGVQAIVSSIEDLINVFKQQTKEYQSQQQQKQAQKAVNSQWSSEYVAKLLNMQNEQREQLEGSLFWHFGNLQSGFSFDNLTLEDLPELMQYWENKLSQGQQLRYNKMLIGEESALAVPTVSGLPFIYTYDTPVLIKSQANVKLVSKPQISTGQVLQKPDTVEAEFEIMSTISGRIQTQLGIFTPFDHQRYTAGYIKNFQLTVPLTGTAGLNVRKRELKLQVQNPGSQQNVRLAHFSSWPFTSQTEIYSPKPNLKIVRSDEPFKRNILVGDKATGVAFSLQITSDERIDPAYIYEKLRQDDAISAMLSPWVDEDIQYVNVDFGIDADKSTAQQVALRWSYQTDYQPKIPSKPNSNEPLSSIPTFAEDPEKRQKEFIENLGSPIGSAEVLVGDATIEFQGQSRIKYSLTAGLAKSNVDPQGRFMVLLRQYLGGTPQTSAYVQAVSTVPNTNGLDLDYAMQMDPTSTVNVQGLLLHKQQLSRADAHIKLSKSHERVQYLKQQDNYHECKHQMQQGNTQLPICAGVTARANLLDEFQIQMKYNNMDPYLVNATYFLYSLLRHELYPRFEENIVEPQQNNQLNIEGQFSPDLETVNVSIASGFGKVEVRNVELSDWAREFLVPHPVFHVRSRLEGEALEYETYKPICVLDKTEASTFDNNTYPLRLSNAWTVLLQFVPRRPSPAFQQPDLSVLEQLDRTAESYVVYARAAQESPSQKEIQIVLQMPSTQGKVVKIVMKPSAQGKAPKVLVNDQEVKYTSKISSDFYGSQVQIYGLPNQEVKLEVRDAFYVIFNGQTLKLTAVNSKFRDAARGLCGTFTGEPETDFLAPNNCIFHDPQEFVQSYTASQSTGPQPRAGQQCYQKNAVHANYISNQDAGRASDYDKRSGDECTGHISRYVEKDGNICFTIRALPFCKEPCKPLQLTKKSIDVKCLEPTATTAYWRSRLDGNQNQDFSMMQPTEKLPMYVPSRCVAN